MKTFKSIVIALVACVAIASQAQVRFVTGGALVGGDKTFTCAAVSGTNVGYTIDVRNQTSVPLQIELMADASGAYTASLNLQYSVDGSVFANSVSGSRVLAIAFNGVTKQTTVTNIPTYGCAYIYVASITNATASINVTNGVLKAPVNYQAP